MSRGSWALNRRTLETTAASPEEAVQFGATEMREFFNAGGGMGHIRGRSMGSDAIEEGLSIR